MNTTSLEEAMSIVVMALVFLLISPQGIVQGDKAINLRCQCIEKDTRRIGRYLGKVEVYPANSHCKEMEIIATLKKDGQRICLDPNAPWVKRILSRKQRSKQFKKASRASVDS